MKKIFLFLTLLSVVGMASEKKDSHGNKVKNGYLSDNFFLGFQNEIDTGMNNLLVGYKNILQSGNKSLILGNENKVHGSKFNNNDGVLVIGNENDVDSSQYSIVNGKWNKLDLSHSSSVVGASNKLTNSSYTHVVGQGNSIDGSGGSSIIGYENEVQKDSFHAQVFGFKNKVKKGQDAFVHGMENRLENSSWSHIEGTNNSIINNDNTVNSNNSTTKDLNYIYGAYNKIKDSSLSYIQGYASNIENGNNSVIIGGYFTRVNMANSIAIGAFSNTREIKNKGYLTNQSVDGVYSLAIGGEYKYKDDKGKEHLIKAKRRIQGLADGAENDEAVTVAQLKKVEGKIAQVEKIDKKADLALGGVSNAIAMANLVQVSSYSKHRHNLSAAYGYYSGAHALAIGFSGINKERNFVYKLSGSVNNHGNLALGLGLGVMLGSKDNELENSKRIEKLEKENREIKELLHKLLKK